jgi:hypothetical protein
MSLSPADIDSVLPVAQTYKAVLEDFLHDAAQAEESGNGTVEDAAVFGARTTINVQKPNVRYWHKADIRRMSASAC